MGKIQLTLTFVAAVVARLRDLASRFSRRIKSSVTIAAFVAIAVLAGHTVSAQITPPSQPLASLKTVPIPGPDYTGYVKDKSKAIALGKALFWDMQVGSDGRTSCATCHFHAGADNRVKNQINPGILRVDASGNPNPDNTFRFGGPNYTLKATDFPFHKLADVNDRKSTVISDINDVESSQGVFNSSFNSVTPGNPKDNVTQLDDATFNVGGIETRRVEPRNTPTIINAVFNFRNFWDGRAQNSFNGVNPFGLRDPNAKLYKAATSVTPPQTVSVKLKNSSLASQAVGPPLSSFEMSADGRTFQDVGKKAVGTPSLLGDIINLLKSLPTGLKLPRDLGQKLLSSNLKPLAQQEVAVDDSVLGIYKTPDGKGLNKTYKQLIEAAFQPEWWNSTWSIQVDKNDGSRQPVLLGLGSLIDPNKKTYTLMEYNFSLFFGLAIQLYESTLVSDNAPIDQFLEGNTSALTAQQQHGLTLFQNSACIFCHAGAEFTAASVRNVEKSGRITRSPAPGNPLEDTGWFKIGVRPELEDPGVGAKDGLQPVSRSLSEARLAQQGKFQEVFGEAPNIIPGPNDVVEDEGLFKAPGLRNVELTAPYMHNGGMLTLRQVVDFYSRGAGDDNPNIPRLPVLNLSDQNKNDLVAFLKALTDERVRYEKAPFDHPQLFVPNGHPGNETSVTNDGTGKATDVNPLLEIPAIGRNGRTSRSPNFLE
ncbi:MAG: cytochrome c peroxidase [Nostoc sp.]|uniref:cytochrome-c peroxidase n=1 Tax=Nostoc sp. TaxID=1180 RepID=UPI002FFC3A1C